MTPDDFLSTLVLKLTELAEELRKHRASPVAAASSMPLVIEAIVFLAGEVMALKLCKEELEALKFHHKMAHHSKSGREDV